MPKDPKKKKADDFPNLTDLISEIQEEQRAPESLIGKHVIAKIVTKPDGSHTLFEAPKKLVSGWDDDEPNATNISTWGDNPSNFFTADTMQQMLDHMNESHINKIFSKLLKGNEAEAKPLMEVVIDPKTDMHWHPKGKEKMLASQMETRHLFFSLRLLFNKAVPSEFRIDVDESQGMTVQVKDNETLHAIKVLFHQIGKRDNISDDHLEKLKYMARICRQHL
jgi:hypothetical protein